MATDNRNLDQMLLLLFLQPVVVFYQCGLSGTILFPCELTSYAGYYQAGARGSFNTAADGFHSNKPAATCRYSSTPVCRSEGRSHDLHVGPETGRRGHRGHI